MKQALTFLPVIVLAVLVLAFVSTPLDFTGAVTAEIQGNYIALGWFIVLIVMFIVYVMTTHRQKAKETRINKDEIPARL